MTTDRRSPLDGDDGIARRSFVKAAVATGGAAALAACLDRETADVPRGPEEPTGPERQHAWNDVLRRDAHGNPLAPRHHVALLLDLDVDGPPSADGRSRLTTALQDLERAYARGPDGLLVTVGYSPAYFDRFEASLPPSVDLPEPAAMAPFEDPDFDDPDLLVHLASDHGSAVLGAERGLLGEREEVNGVGFGAGLGDVATRRDRRTGFVGAGLPADHQEVDGVPPSEPVDDDAPLYMGFKSGFEGNQATEDRVTIQQGRFAGGTTQHLSMIDLNLQQWYEQDDRHHRVATMFCPVHAEEDLVDGVGENLGDSTAIQERRCPADADDHAREEGVVGHSQKAARAREDGDPIILRRDFDSADDDRASLHFLSLQRGIGDFRATREAMNGSELAEEGAVGQRTNNGILQYMTVERRGNYIVPPRRHRALPRPR